MDRAAVLYPVVVSGGDDAAIYHQRGADRHSAVGQRLLLRLVCSIQKLCVLIHTVFSPRSLCLRSVVNACCGLSLNRAPNTQTATIESRITLTGAMPQWNSSLSHATSAPTANASTLAIRNCTKA